MNARRIAIATAIAILLVSAFPPFQITLSNRIIGLGYSFLFAPPHYGGATQMLGSVDLGTLFVEYVGILAIGALAWLFATSMPIRSTTGETTQNQPAKMKWGRLKKVATTGLVITIALVAMALSKGIVRAFFHHPTKTVSTVSAPSDTIRGFDVAGARKAGYSDSEIVTYLAKESGFDLAGARKAGQSDSEILAHLASDKPPRSGPAPKYDSEGWTQESTGSTEVGPWLKYSPPGTRYCRYADRTIIRLYPPGAMPNAEKANPFCLGDSTEDVPK